MSPNQIPDPAAASPAVALPLLPLRDVVVFPHMVIPLFVGRPKSIKALEAAMESGKSILLAAQRVASKDDPGAEDLYTVCSIANILQMLKLPDGTVKVLVEGNQRANLSDIQESAGFLTGVADPVPPAEGPEATEVEAMRRTMPLVLRCCCAAELWALLRCSCALPFSGNGAGAGSRGGHMP
jgi:ATP-dependent Lon protease